MEPSVFLGLGVNIGQEGLNRWDRKQQMDEQDIDHDVTYYYAWICTVNKLTSVLSVLPYSYRYRNNYRCVNDVYFRLAFCIDRATACRITLYIEI